MQRPPVLVPFLLLAVASVTCITGCADHRDGNIHAQSTVSGAKASRQDLIAAKAEIGKAIADLDLITRHGDLKPAFHAFSDVFDTLRKREKRRRCAANVRGMDSDSDAYIAQWQLEGAQYSNGDLTGWIGWRHHPHRRAHRDEDRRAGAHRAPRWHQPGQAPHASGSVIGTAAMFWVIQLLATA